VMRARDLHPLFARYHGAGPDSIPSRTSSLPGAAGV
jgi:hypothetical protein